jgi:hypothetical protein
MAVLLPIVDQYLPAKATTVRQKMAEMGMTSNQAVNFAALGQNPSVDALMQAAATAPQGVQAQLYRQAAYKALEEGNTDRARQITNDLLPPNMRPALMQRIETRELTKKAGPSTLEEIRQMVNRFQTDNEKINLLIETANVQSDPKLTGQLLEEARQIVNHRATSYEHFEQQLRVARAFSKVDPARSFEILDPAISHLNELLAAAAVLSGFEINMFRDGEMSIQGGTGMTSTINRFGQELAALARIDFERSDVLAGRFQLAEPRIMTRLAMVQGLLNNRVSFTGPPTIMPPRPVGQFTGARPE